MANSNTLEDLLPIRSSDRNYAYQMAYVLFDYGFSDNNICYLVNLEYVDAVQNNDEYHRLDAQKIYSVIAFFVFHIVSP